MLTEKDYCDYDTCVALKELGFSEPTLAYYDGFLPSKALLYLVIDEDCMPEYGVNVFDLLSNSNNYKDSKFIDAPTLWEAQKWLREEKMIGVFVSGFKNGYTFWINDLLNGDTLYQGFFDNQTGEKYKSYEEALSEGIKESIKILKNRNNS